MFNKIIVPEKITGIKFLDFDYIFPVISKDTKTLFYLNVNGWYIKDNYPSWKPKYKLYEEHLDPINGQLILGLDKIVKGNNSVPDKLYTLTELDIERNIGSNYILISKAVHPITQETFIPHSISKKDLLKVGDKALFLKEFEYKLLYEVAGDLIPVEGMNFSAQLGSNRVDILKVSYFTLDSILNNKKAIDMKKQNKSKK